VTSKSCSHAACCCTPHDHHHESVEATPSPAVLEQGRSFRVSGLDCAEEVRLLRAELGPLVGGGDHLAFDVLAARMIVPASCDPTVIIAAVARTGMQARLWDEPTVGADPEQRRRRMQIALAALSGGLTGVGVLLEQIGGGSLIPSRIALAGAILIGLWMVLPKALLAARRVRPDMNLLMSLAVFGAVILGDWAEAATVSFLFALSLALESWSTGRARRAIAALMDLTPPFARVRGTDGQESQVAPDQVPVGALFLVRPGERIPLDGRVRQGTSAVDQAPITGESLPVTKQPGDTLYAGSLNGEGVLEVENLKRASETTLARVGRLVAEAQSRRSATERWIDRFAAIYTPIVFLLALLVLVGSPLLLGTGWDEALYRALVLLVIACPCALVISTPVTVVAAMATAARHGVLIKGGAALETAADLTLIAFDKTGTLTTGRLVVEQVVAVNGGEEQQVLARAAGLEAQATHPIAEAIRTQARRQGLTVPVASAVQTFPGRGVTGQIDHHLVWLGSPRFLAERGFATAEHQAQAEQLAAAGRTVVVIGQDDAVIGLIALADTIRPAAPAALASLRASGLRHYAVLTGDNQATAQRIATDLGLNRDLVRAELLPEDKEAAIAQLMARHGAVAMVGDGVNDAPALARARLGIAMGAAGSDVAIETADVALMSDDLHQLPWLIAHARRMKRVLRQNIALALGIKLLFTVLACLGLASLWGAIVADTGASLLVVGNGLRLLRRSAAAGGV